MYSYSCCSCSFEAEITKIGQSSHKMYSNTIVNFQEPTIILNAGTKKSGNLSYAPCTYPSFSSSSLNQSTLLKSVSQVLLDGYLLI